MEYQHYYQLGPFTVFDVETTGMSCCRDRIVELSALRVEVTGEIDRFSTLIDPGCHISGRVSAVHHITDSMVCGAPRFQDIGLKFLDFCRGSTLVAHNARFDLGFLQESLARHGLPLWQGKTLDTLKMVKMTHPGLPSYSLQNLRRTLQLTDEFENMQAHRASADVEWTRELLQIILEKLLKQNGPGQSCL